MADDNQKHFQSLLRIYSSNGRDGSVKISSNEGQVTIPAVDDSPSNTFPFDALLDTDATPKAAYRSKVKALVDSVLKGYNGTLVTLGLESADHFSFALDSTSGLLLEAAGHVLRCIKRLQQKGMSSNLTVPCSYVMIANERVHDLLLDFKERDKENETATPGAESTTPALAIKDSKVHGCRTIEIKSINDVKDMLSYGSKTRNGILLNLPDCGVYHCAFTIGIEYSKFGSMFAPISGIFTLSTSVIPDDIDLDSIEAGNISTDTKSIAAVMSVIKQTASTASTSYSDSILTQLLQATFGGNCETLLLTHVPSSPSLDCLSQVRCLLQLGSEARLIENKPDKTELAEKALMDAYLKEMRRQSQWNKANKVGVDSPHLPAASRIKAAEDELMVAQALASAVKDGFEYDSDEYSDDEDNTEDGKMSQRRRRKMTLKSKKLSLMQSHSHAITTEDITVDSLVASIQDPDNGVPRAAESALVNVKIHRGKGSVFSGAAIVRWLLANIDGIDSIEDAELLGQILLDKGAIFHSDGSSLFFNAENLFYYARDPLRPGKTLSIEEIKALLSPSEVKMSAVKLPTLQVTKIEQPKGVIEEPVNEVEEEEDNGPSSTPTVPTNTFTTKPSSSTIASSSGHQDIPPDSSTPLTVPVGVHNTPTNEIPGKTTSNSSATPEGNPPHPISQSDSQPGNGAVEEVAEDNGHSPDIDTEQQNTEDTNDIADQSMTITEVPNLEDLQDVDLVTLERSTDYPHPLHFAAAVGKETGVIEQLVRWYSVDCLDDQQRTPLMFAALGNKASVCRHLIDFGAMVNRKDQRGLTAVHVACYHGSKDALHVLLRHKAEVTAQDRMLHSVYHWSTVKESPDCLKLALKSTPSVIYIDSFVDKQGFSPLHWAIHYNRPEHLKLLIPRALNLLQVDSKGRTLMTYALKQSRYECMMVLGTSKNAIELSSIPDKGGLTPLHHASVEKTPSFAACLLSIIGKVDPSCIEACDSMGRTPLHYATTYQRQENVQLLLQFGANKSARDIDGRSPLELAAGYGPVGDNIMKLFEGPAQVAKDAVDLSSMLPRSNSYSSGQEVGSKACLIL